MIVVLFMAVKEIHEKLGEVLGLFNGETWKSLRQRTEMNSCEMKIKTRGSSIIQTVKLKIQSGLNKILLKDCE